jgi:murein DD-endopeptidase MepM/ murein hydrolase activator NlpD
VFQGYNGSFSHQNEKALDFTMPEGTEVVAAREGVVIKVLQDNTESCPREECKKFNNYVSVYHSDGTFGIYNHIKYMGSLVKVGDTVKKGDHIALSGNTGFTSGPHLHFVCYIPGVPMPTTVATFFRTDNGSKKELLVEKKTYLKNY